MEDKYRFDGHVHSIYEWGFHYARCYKLNQNVILIIKATHSNEYPLFLLRA